MSFTGRNFCLLQVLPVEALTEIPDISPSRLTADMAALLEAADEYDSLHDTVFRLGGSSRRRYALHSLVLAAGSETLAKQLKFAEAAVSPIVLDIEENIQPVIFEQILRYLYTRSCDLITPGPCSIFIENNNKTTMNGATTTAQSDDNENFITVDPGAVSAFAAFRDQQQQRSRGSSSRKKNAGRRPVGEEGAWGAVTDVTSPGGKAGMDVTSPGGKGGSAATTTNPLVLLQEAAKSLGIAGLVKIIDCLRSDS
jgi:hypothetical protein